MGVLKHVVSGEEYTLAAEQTLGRSAGCQLRFATTDSVSRIHARIQWSGTRWEVCDLASKNGTYVDGRKIAAGDTVEIRAGSQLRLGIEDCQLCLIDALPPCLMATNESGEVYTATDDSLCLPSADQPELVIFSTHDGWMVAVGEEPPREIELGEVIESSGHRWTVNLPKPFASTREVVTTIELEYSTQHFSVSRDGESIELAIESGDKRIADRGHAYLTLLVELARARARDRACADLPEPDQGWCDRKLLARDLGVRQGLLNVWLVRAQQALERLGVIGAAGMVERRPNQLRFGPSNFTIDDPHTPDPTPDLDA